MRASYTSGYFVALPPEHPFPMGKFPALAEILLMEELITPGDIYEPNEVTWEELQLVHTADYLSRLEGGNLGAKAERKMGLPWSHALVRRSRLAVQGTIEAARMALEDGIAANLAGGTHHAYPGHGEGFCVLNDVAVAIRVLQRRGQIGRALVVDLDVHQGNGTAVIFDGDESTYTFSMHGERNYPFEKEASALDVGLPDGMGDDDYMAALEQNLETALVAARSDLTFYLAGVDALAGDRYGRLSLSREGIQRRDHYVIERLCAAEQPLCLLMSGGYAETPQATADLHAIAHREASHAYSRNCR